MRSTPYLSTSQTAQMLGLSVGTIQRMVESGVLQAYTTEGGHRRILAASIRGYCEAKGMPTRLPTAATANVCIIHHGHLAPELEQTLQALPKVQLVSHPLELAGIGERCPVFLVDAHVTWLDWPDLQRPQSLSPTARFIIYNSADLSAQQHQALAQHAELYAGDISTDWIAGLLLGMQVSGPDLPLPQPAHH